MLKYLMGGRRDKLCNVLIWSASMPTNHYLMNKEFKFTLKTLISAGFVSCNPSTEELEIYGVSESLNIKTTDEGIAKFTALMESGHFYRTIVSNGGYSFPAIFITTEDVSPFTHSKTISKDEIYQSIITLLTTYHKRSDLPEPDLSFIE